MAKSFMVQSRCNSGEAYPAGVLNYISFGTGGEVEGDSASEGVNAIIGAACTVSVPACRISAHNITAGDLTVTLQKNNVNTSVVITIDSGDSVGIVTGAGSATFAAGDKARWRLDGATTGGITLIMLGCAVDSTGDALTFIQCNSSGSSTVVSETTRFQRVGGQRDFRDTESEAETEWPLAGDFEYFYTGLGTTSYDQDAESGLRVAGVDGNNSVTWADTDDGGLKWDSTSTDSISANDKINYFIRHDNGGTGTSNVEKIGATFIPTDGESFVLMAGADYQTDQQDNLTRYYPIGGNFDYGVNSAESTAQWPAPFDFTATLIFFRIVTDVLTGDFVLQLRKDGVDVGTAKTVTGGTAGYYTEVQDVDYDEGDLISLEGVTGAGTRVRLGYVGIVAVERVAASTLNNKRISSMHFQKPYQPVAVGE